MACCVAARCGVVTHVSRSHLPEILTSSPPDAAVCPHTWRRSLTLIVPLPPLCVLKLSALHPPVTQPCAPTLLQLTHLERASAPTVRPSVLPLMS